MRVFYVFPARDGIPEFIGAEVVADPEDPAELVLYGWNNVRALGEMQLLATEKGRAMLTAWRAGDDGSWLRSCEALERWMAAEEAMFTGHPDLHLIDGGER